MKTKILMTSVLLGAFAGAVMMLCVAAATTKANVGSPVIPTAQSYAVQIGNTEYRAKSVKIDGDWISFTTDKTTMLAPCHSVVFIEPQQPK